LTPPEESYKPKPIKSEPKHARPQKRRVKRNKKNVAFSLPAEDLSPAPDVNDPDWPVAVHPNLVLTDKGDVEKQFRALQVANIIAQAGVEFKDKRVLDVGCGEGHIATELAQRASFVLGYDIVSGNNWDEREEGAKAKNLKVQFSSDPLFIENQEPFDVAILFDVLDHAIKSEPSDLLAWCANRLADDGMVFVQCHPWSARHGGHLYDQLNKAYIHLVFTPDELAQMDVSATEPGAKTNQRIVRPLATYDGWIKKAGLQIKDRTTKSAEVEPFFEKLLPRMNEVSWAGKEKLEKIAKILQTESINYVLTK
jgi:2-polyprenyl-3-methyl-5-hydroxy-6-metoxy-1,4-benzoquinol methylase